jgi:hypothetical protein
MKQIALLILLGFGYFAKAQITEINPMIGWNYVNSQETEITNGLWFNTDFPAEKGYDYIFVMNHDLDSVSAALKLYNLQDQLIVGKDKDTSTKLINLPFDVSESGTYRIFFIINDNKGGANLHKVQLMLIRRKKL